MTLENTISPILSVKDLSVSYGGHNALVVPFLEVAPDQVMAIIGPNGSGKTTLLLCLSLLLKPSVGHILYRDRIVPDGISATQMRRHFAVVFQEPLLLNLSVADNVGLGLRLHNLSKSEITSRTRYWLERFGIPSLADRQARTLSGGEAQRTSLARAFALQPEVLFLDEPFAALDVPTRQSLLGDFNNILRETRFTTVMVTHDHNEAQTLAQRVLVMMNGKIAQSGTPGEVFSSPLNVEVARFVGMENILEGTISTNKNCSAEINLQGRIVQGISTCQEGGKVNVCLRPEDIALSTTQPSINEINAFSGHITSLLLADPLVRVSIDCGFPLVALITRNSAEEMQLAAGSTVHASFKAAAVHVITA